MTLQEALVPGATVLRVMDWDGARKRAARSCAPARARALAVGESSFNSEQLSSVRTELVEVLSFFARRKGHCFDKLSTNGMGWTELDHMKDVMEARA